jgi:predicted  nucleic acid-binding Zn-ribbon protein
MEPSDLTIEILKDIRDEVKSVRDEVRQTNVRLDQTNERLETGLAEVSRRIVESEIRTSTAITELAGTVHEMTQVLRAQHDLGPRVERCEHDIAALQRIVGQG